MKTDVYNRHCEARRAEAISVSEIASSACGLLAMTVAILCVNLWVNCTDVYCLNVSPGRIEISIPASKIYEGVLTVRNNEKRVIGIKVRIEDWRKAVEGINTEDARKLNWLEIGSREFALKEDEVKEIKIKVKVPEKAEGELNGMIFIDASPKEIGEGAIGINTSIGIPIYVMIKGTEKFKAAIEELKVVNNSPLELAVTIKNSGNVHIRPTGTIVIARSPDKVGTTKQSLNITVPLNEYNYPVLPDSSRTLEIRSNNQLEEGEYIADIKMGFENRKCRKKATLKIQ